MEIKIGNWVDAYEGIGKVISISNFYVEEYSSEFRGGVELGSSLTSQVVYKILCDFKGKLRKRNVFSSCSIDICTPICSESSILLNNDRLRPHTL